MLDSGVIKRFGVVVRHHELGYRANAMVVWDVPDDARSTDWVCSWGDRTASPCATGVPRRLPDWPYNLFCMIHGQDRDEVLAASSRMTRVTGRCEPCRTKCLFSRRRFKQRGARYRGQCTEWTSSTGISSMNCRAAFPVCERPFLEAAEQLGTTESELITRIRCMLDDGLLTRFGPMYHAERLGGALTLGAMQVPPAAFRRGGGNRQRASRRWRTTTARARPQHVVRAGDRNRRRNSRILAARSSGRPVCPVFNLPKQRGVLRRPELAGLTCRKASTAATRDRRRTGPPPDSGHPGRPAAGCATLSLPGRRTGCDARRGDAAHAAHAGRRAYPPHRRGAEPLRAWATWPTACRCGTCPDERVARAGRAGRRSWISSATAIIARGICRTGRTTCLPWCTAATATKWKRKVAQIAELLGDG